MKRMGLLIVPVLLAACSSSGGSPGATSLASVPFDDVSVPYGISVDLVYTGAPCGGHTNSGYFSRLTYSSGFHGVVFAGPTTSGLPGPMGAVFSADSDMQAGMITQQVQGEGKVLSFSFCPMYETETESHVCLISYEPQDFGAALAVVPPQGDEGSATLKYFSFSKEAGKPIMRWESAIGIGQWGGIGGAENVLFTTTWTDLLAGGEFSFQHTVPGEYGASWVWSVRFVPEPS